MYKCKCGREFETKMGLGGHKGHCNKDRDYSSCAWNKGLTKDEHPSLAVQAKKVKKFQQENSTWKGRHHTQETRDKLSKIRIKFLEENPDKVPYLINHSSNKSWPEEVFENALKSSGITGWETRYRNGIYQYDFAFPKLKIDVEVDGGTHKQEKVIKIDERRDKWSKSQGWKVIRFEAERVKKDVIGCINELKNYLEV